MSRFRVCVVLLAVLVSVPAAAQVVTSSTGAINGVVTDTSQAVLPGVTVTAQSVQMMGTRETITDSEGRYQFAAIPPGDYTVTFDLPGFSKFIREGVRIGLGFTGTVNAELGLATQQETITVTGQSPVVDTTSTRITNNYDAETMGALPTARDFPALMAETPGVASTTIDVGGSAAMNQTSYIIYGMSAGGAVSYIRTEGVVAPSLGNHYNDFGSFDEVQIETAAHTAEMPLVGVYANMITKSGGNAYHGTLYKDYETSKWGSTNIDERQLALGVRGGGRVAAQDVNKMLDYQDFNAGVGGYIKKDRLWWYGSFRDNRMHSNFVNYPTEAAIQQVNSAQVKATYNQTPNHKFIYWYNYNLKYMPAYGFSGGTSVYSANAPHDEDFPIGQTKIEYNAVLSPSVFLEVRAGKFFKSFIVYAKGPVTPRYIDRALQTITGSHYWNRQRDLRPQVTGSLSYFKRGWGTSHNFKMGWDVGQHQTPNDVRGSITRDANDQPAPIPDLIYILNNGVPSQVQFNLSPQYTFSYQWTHSAYVNDTWQLNDRLSLNMGLRFDRYRNGYPDQVHHADSFGGRFLPQPINFPADSDTLHFNVWGPRIGVVWNLSGDGKTLVKSNYGSYGMRPTTTFGNPAIGSGQTSWAKTFTWTDTNRDLLWQAGEEGRLVSEIGGTANNIIDPNWKNSKTHDLAVWVEREVMADFGIRTGFVHRRNTNTQYAVNTNRPMSSFNIARTARDPGPDGVAGNADDGGLLAVYDLAASALAAPILSVTTHNELVDSEKYSTWELSGTKRMTKGWSLNASYVINWIAQASKPTGLGSGTVSTNPNQFLGSESDGLFHFTTSQSKLASIFEIPFESTVSSVLRFQAGQPWGRQISIPMNYGLETIQVEPTSARRNDNILLLDLRLEKSVTFGPRKLGLFLDVFNLFNGNPAENVVQTSSSSFLRPLSIVPPRVARIGAKFEW